MRLLVLVQLCVVSTESYMAIWPSGRSRPRNMTAHPPCVNDEDCAGLSEARAEDYRCFQYMCYPWRREDSASFRHCRRTSDCRGLEEEEGGLGEDGTCWRHPDRRNVHSGICLDKKETLSCQQHEACPPHLSCVAGHCGDSEYLAALATQPCSDHHLCEDLLIGTDCCFDIAGGVERISRGDLTSAWGKKCCDNLRSPITLPPANLSVEVIKKLDQKIQELYSPWGLEAVVCEGLQHSLMTRLSSCQEFTTTTTSTTTTTTSTTTTARSQGRVTVSERNRQGSHPVSQSSRTTGQSGLLVFGVAMMIMK